MLLWAPSGQRLRMLLNSLRCTGQLTIINYPIPNVKRAEVVKPAEGGETDAHVRK